MAGNRLFQGVLKYEGTLTATVYSITSSFVKAFLFLG